MTVEEGKSRENIYIHIQNDIRISKQSSWQFTRKFNCLLLSLAAAELPADFILQVF